MYKRQSQNSADAAFEAVNSELPARTMRRMEELTAYLNEQYMELSLIHILLTPIEPEEGITFKMRRHCERGLREKYRNRKDGIQ